jgi:hypothetical protein
MQSLVPFGTPLLNMFLKLIPEALRRLAHQSGEASYGHTGHPSPTSFFKTSIRTDLKYTIGRGIQKLDQ